MDQNYNFPRDSILPSFWANRIQDFVSSLGRFRLRQATANSIEVPAGPEDGAVSLAIERRWRFVEATVARAHPGGAAGTYDVYVTAAENDVTNAPDPFTDNTDYSFDLAIVADGATPAIVPGTVDIFRQVGSLVWDGGAITSVTQLLGAVAEAHAADHAVGGADPLSPAAIGAAAAADARFPTAGEKAALAGTSGVPGAGNKYVTDGDARNTNARAPTAHTHTHRETHTWALLGEVKVPVGDTDYIPPMHVAKLAGETLTLKKLIARINGGTSVTLKVQKNGADIGWNGAVIDTLTIGGETFSGDGDEALADGDAIAIVVTGVAGTPKNLSVTAVFERVVP